MDSCLGSTPTWADTSNIDLKIQLKEILGYSPVDFLFVHFKSHQDNEIPYGDLSLPTKLNFHYDNSAKDHLLVLTSPSPLCALPDLTYPHLHDDNGLITSPFTSELLRWNYQETVRRHLNMTQEIFHTIDW